MRMFSFIALFLIMSIFSLSNLNAAECFLMKDLSNGKFIEKSGGEICETRFSPCSTFKIPLSLMGFDSGVLKNEKEPEMEYKDDYGAFIKGMHDSTHNPEKWMKNSTLWYSREAVTKKIGMEKFAEYVKKFNYGNMDLSGDEGKNNGLTHSWISSSLKISPMEQMDFIANILAKEFPISDHAYNMTRKITYIQEIYGLNLHGKTGSCLQRNEDGSENPNRFAGWFVGWLENENKKIVFARFMKDDEDVPKDDYVGLRLKKKTIEEIFNMRLE